MEKILDWLKSMKDKIVDFWNKYTAKQKTVIVCVVLAIFLAMVLLVYFLTRPVYVQFLTIDDTKTASQMVDALDEAEIPNQVETQGEQTIIKVKQEYFTDATLLIGSDESFSSEMTWDNALQSDMSSTSEQRQTKIKLALQNSIAKGLCKFDGVKSATVFIDQPEDDGTYAASQKETAVSVNLELATGTEVSEETGKTLALFVANAAGCNSTDKIVVMDTNRNLIFSGESSNTLGGTVSDVADYKVKLRNTIAEDVRDVLLKVGYNNVQIGTSNIIFDMDKVTQLSEEYSVPEGRDEGVKTSDYAYKSTGNSGSGGTPGTDSNSEDTDYMLVDEGSSNSETTLDKNNYAPNKVTENREKEIGAVKPEESSIAIVLTRYRNVYEETLEADGTLDNISFEMYAEQNNTPTALTVPDEVVQLVANNTGIAENRISIQAYEQPIFQSKDDSEVNVTNYLMIILAVLIAALLVFVIVKGTSPVRVTETDPELSVEDLLATTSETPLDEIDMESGRSELLIMIDKFVDENPEAVALLLRNWLNEDWG